mmetsp:Transcript_36185/g.144614  ORF Transcript_36185/g.144614 Transcript_36185/m.144614 type:complete len:435 (-) Transcript_36185:1212-2516(-)|eukprot:CAMPEP_0113968834 /NCGR_PEP_ID=MMETSP0011_2-20120614/9810_1 /TAXON_ID=101924 /ORGANISM="Rhodosorus marinus" /LENGTH=434 /DNA_ID=CAMNT_0000982081 /DNA_START=351 /DNA_END=1655 /DNA_ORIENTATION=- /assembly_acc=CAM_ASM_000156
MKSRTVPLLRGMRDYLPSCFAIRQSIENEARRVSRLYGYQEVDTPVVEETSLFRRTLGSGSDVVQKEMFEFKDKSSTEVTLRPEGTAGIGRMITRKDFALYRSLPHRFFYCGPMFRYERPQKGRQRQFSQVGVECIGEESSLADAEVVVMAHQFLDSLELASSPTLQINTLGDVEDRLAYKAELTNFLQERKEKLSVDSLNRLERGAVLRILDSKESNDKELLKGAPRLEDFLSERSSTRFENVLRALEKEGIPFERSSHLVRGLDYYCHTVFEYVSSEIGAQGAVLAGGRYDGLIESLGGPPTPAVGWAAGTDRLALLRTETIDSQFLPICAIIPTGNHNEETEDLIKGYCMRVAGALRRSGIETHLQYKTRYTSKLLATALQNGASAAIFIGENEVSRGKFILKDLKSRAEREVGSIDELADAVSNILNAFS